MKERYTLPKLVKAKRGWYIYFKYDGTQVRDSYNLNKIDNLNKREAESREICRLILNRLKDGWNPNIPFGVQIQNDMYIVESLRFAFEKKKLNLSRKTICDYNSTINFVETAVKNLKIDSLKITDTKKIHVKSIIETVKSTRNWSNKSYNKNLGYLKAIFSELVDWEIIESNPAYGIKQLKVPETNANIPATDDEVKLIKEKLLNEFPSFYIYIITIFHTGIRPEELLHIQLKMVHLKKNEINIPPEITKTNIARIVPINPFLKDYFEQMKIHTYDDDFFLFGSNREHSNRGLKKDLDFTPGPKRLNRDAASKLWRKMIKDDLGIDVNMYSMKHLGANKKILAGIEIDALRELYGHTSQMMTLRYAKIVKEVNRTQILQKSPDF